MSCKVRLVGFVWGDEFQRFYGGAKVYPGADGAVEYEIKTPEMRYRIYQPFKQGASLDINGKPVWGWDGNREHPTLTPSFLMDHPPVHLHLFIRSGRVELCGDSNTELVEGEL